MVRISEVSFKKIRKIVPIVMTLRFSRHVTTTKITTSYLQQFQDGLQILAKRDFRNQPKKFLKNSLMPAFMFLRIYKDFSYKSSSVKSVRATIMFVSFPRHHHQNICRRAQSLRFSISLKFKYLH